MIAGVATVLDRFEVGPLNSRAYRLRVLIPGGGPLTLTTAAGTPRVWVGCLHCYNSTRLVGTWVDAASAEHLSQTDVHREAGRVWLGREEAWCLDTDGIPNFHEMGVTTAAAWGELHQCVGAEQWPALCAWVDSSYHVTDGDDLPDASTFEERYRGQWDSWTEYADLGQRRPT